MSTDGSFFKSGNLAMMLRRTSHSLDALWVRRTDDTKANPFLAKAGEASTTVQVATCAVSGGFIHLYTRWTMAS